MDVKIKDLKEILQNDIKACDIKWTMFVAAAESYRYDSRLRPFPPFYRNKDNQEISDVSQCITKIIKIINETPPFHLLLNILTELNTENLNVEVIELLHWVLVTVRDPYLISVPRNEFDSVLSKVPKIETIVKPLHIFKVMPQINSVAEEKFQQYAKTANTLFGFHGSKLDSFHSIINYGLQQHLCKTALFGEGIYLSSELHVSIAFSTSGVSWKYSCCGQNLSCIAMCEFIEHPTHLKSQIKETNGKNNKSEVPDKYFVITNNDIIRVRYLLVYGDQIKRKKFIKNNNSVTGWILNHKSIVAMCFYGILLVGIGLANSRIGDYLRTIVWNKTLAIFESFTKIY